MNSLIRLTDIQLVLLATAAQRDNGSLLPLPDTLGEEPARIRRPSWPSFAAVWRSKLTFCRALTPGAPSTTALSAPALRAAIAVDADELARTVPDETTSAAETKAEPAPVDAGAPARTKAAHVLDLLRRDTGATLNELVAATGW